MSWAIVTPLNKAAPIPAPDVVTLSTRRLPHGHTALVLAVGGTVATRLGLEAGSVVEVAHGDGTHAGLIRLAKAPPRCQRLEGCRQQGRGVAPVRVGLAPGLGRQELQPRPAGDRGPRRGQAGAGGADPAAGGDQPNRGS